MRARQFNLIGPLQLPYAGKPLLRFCLDSVTFGLLVPRRLRVVHFAVGAGFFWCASALAKALRLRLNRGVVEYFPL
jgi:hypothetical protein